MNLRTNYFKLNYFFIVLYVFINKSSVLFYKQSYKKQIKNELINIIESCSINFKMAKITKFKVTFVGDQNVGKTSIISRFIQDSFEATSNVQK